MKNEGTTTTAIEQNTARVPSLTFLGLAIGSIVISAAMELTGRKQLALFVGQWAPTFLLLGTYNKIVKTFSAPYDEQERRRHGDHPAPREMGSMEEQLLHPS